MIFLALIVFEFTKRGEDFFGGQSVFVGLLNCLFGYTEKLKPLETDPFEGIEFEDEKEKKRRKNSMSISDVSSLDSNLSGSDIEKDKKKKKKKGKADDSSSDDSSEDNSGSEDEEDKPADTKESKKK